MTPLQVYRSLQRAWMTLFGGQAPRSSLLVLLAQWSLETGNGAASMNFNLAGIKHVPGDQHDYAEYETHEHLNGRDIVLTQQFRAYASLDVAAVDYLMVLRRQFGFAWQAVDSGDVLDFAHRLKLRGYYTAPESEYAAGLEARWAILNATVDPDTVPDSPTALADGRPAVVAPDPGKLEPDDLPPGETT